MKRNLLRKKNYVHRELVMFNSVLHGDCLELMKDIPDKSIDMILCDLPYGTTSCAWDRIIPFEPLWEQYERIIKPKSCIALFSTQPFTSRLIVSNIEKFKYLWTWNKGKVGGFTNAKLKPLKLFEDICIFSDGKTANCNENNMRYYPQGLIKVDKISNSSTDKTKTGYARPSTTGKYKQVFTNYPNQLLNFNLDKERVHPTQKPVAMLEYLIKTYTTEGDLVLDNCAGSGSTGIACINTNRNYILMEKEKEYFEIINKRIKESSNNLESFFV